MYMEDVTALLGDCTVNCTVKGLRDRWYLSPDLVDTNNEVMISCLTLHLYHLNFGKTSGNVLKIPVTALTFYYCIR